MKELSLFKIVMKLNGEVRPVGETNTDNARYANLIELRQLADSIIDELLAVSREKDSHEYSVRRSGEYAHNCLNIIHEATEQANDKVEMIALSVPDVSGLSPEQSYQRGYEDALKFQD